jgi:hypothetical protein
MNQSVRVVSTCVDQMLAKNCHNRLVDFEDHMGDKQADFRNFEVLKYMAK